MALNSPDILVLVLLPMSLDLRGGHKLHFESIDLRALSLLIILCPGRCYFLRLASFQHHLILFLRVVAA